MRIIDKLQQLEHTRLQKTVAAVHASSGNQGLNAVATAATLPGARQRIEIDELTGYPVEDGLEEDGFFKAGDIVGVNPV